MEKFRIGNDLSIFWAILDDDGQPYPLFDKKVRLFVTHPRGRMEVTDDISIQNGHVVAWNFQANRQRYLGTYKLTVEIYSSPTVRVLRRDIEEAFGLVSSSLYEDIEAGKPDINETGMLRLSSVLEVIRTAPIIPQVGPNRNWWVDGVDTGKSSVGLTAYEFAKEQGYEGTEEEYAAECAAVPSLNEASRQAASSAASAARQASKSATAADEAAVKASTATEEANAAASVATEAAAGVDKKIEASLAGVDTKLTELSERIDGIGEGAVGPQGPQGPQGERGEQGPQGEQGPAGPQGERGPEGPQGLQGADGMPGEKGEQGAVGPQGEKGDKGDTGATGPQGEQGEKGADGKSAYDLWIEAGNEGSSEDFLASLKGEQGPQGEQGPVGPEGPQGIQGPVGLQGPQGPAGEKGDKGDKGEQGEKGADGAQGEKGIGISSVIQTTTSSVDDGNNVVTVTLSNGAKSTFTVKNGSKGSQGIQGVQGPKGDTGAIGPEGPKGDKGDTGATGSQGPKGDQGEQGIQGPKGDKGDTGATGPKGDKGDKGDGVAFAVTVVTSESKMTDITKLYALNGEIYRFEGAEGVNEVAAVAVVASEGGEVPLFTNLYVKEEAEINKRISTSAFKDQTGGLLTNYMDIPMGHGVENPVVRIKGLPHPETFGTHDLDRIVCLRDGAEYKQNGNWVMYYCKEGLNNGYYTKEVLEDGTLVLTMKAGGFPAIWGAQDTYTYQPRIAFDNVNNDASALTEAPDLIITLNEEIVYGSAEEPSEPTNKGRWVNTHIKYDADASQMILDNLGELQGYAEIPAYWETEMVDTIEKVQRLKKAAGNNAISFAWCSDAHVMPNTKTEGDTTYLGRLLNKAIKDTFTPLAISTGDEMHGAVLASEDKVYENFVEMKKHFYPMWGKKEFIALLGNHDGAYGKNDQGTQTYQKRIQPNELFDVYFKEQMLDFRRVVSMDGTYFYVDTPQKVRFICLNTHYAGESVEVDEDGFTKVNVYNNNYLGQAQYDWLINEALKLPSDEWTCIVAGHIAPVLGTNLTIPSGSNPAYNYSSSLKDKEVLAGVLNAYIAKGAYTKSYSDANGVGDVSIDCDFSTYKGTMICYIAGHWHCDKTENKSLNGVPIILITSAQDDRDSSLPARVDGTDQETAFDVVVINRKTRKIQCVRCGAGEDRTITY